MELTFWENVHFPQHVTCYMSRVTWHMSRVTCHLSCVRCHIFFIFWQSCEAYWLRVCYHWGQPHLTVAFAWKASHVHGSATVSGCLEILKLSVYVPQVCDRLDCLQLSRQSASVWRVFNFLKRPLLGRLCCLDTTIIFITGQNPANFGCTPLHDHIFWINLGMLKPFEISDVLWTGKILTKISET